VLSSFLTVYAAVIVHRYLYVIICAALQVLAVLYYLSSFIPGGAMGLKMLMKAGYTILSTLIKPFAYVCYKSTQAIFARIFS
jgi:hypothetical protein